MYEGSIFYSSIPCLKQHENPTETLAFWICDACPSQILTDTMNKH